ncbi:IclR family transcriptional regulator [Xylanimonas ulmi]|nr:IclR family transcriptional regulator [Xylanibacterium ulmi]
MSAEQDELTAPGRRLGDVKSAVRTMQVLELLADRGGVPARLRDLSDQLDAPRSSVHALLRTLESHGWVRNDASGSLYALGIKSLVVGTAFLDADPYVRVVRPVLARLRERIDETVHLARIDGERVVYLSTHQSSRDARPISRIGRWLPAHSSGLGKALLAARQDPLPAELVALTPHTLTDPAALGADIEETRRRGYALDVEENAPGLRCLGLALRYTDPVQDAISCSIPTERHTPEREAAILDALRAARAEIEDIAPKQGTF